MELKHFSSAQELAQMAAKRIADAIAKKPDLVLGLPTGETPVLTYDALAERETDFSRVTTFNLDEYYPIAPTDPQSYRYFMNKHLFDRVNVKKENTHVPDGTASDPAQACRDYESAIEAAGGVDLQLLGVGRNGHIGFNEPGTPTDSKTHLVDLTEDTIDANARFFASANDVPRQALTMGVGTILRAKRILILITGETKCEALRKLLSGKEDPAFPVTALQRHPDVTVFCDDAAYGR
ncbi:MAG: glucosamine-6-phosphate deaminase [Oscillospiraceae bacterium]|nr:glucosamine-6-phosphate deaminase [Oscillospiraceae bacterium]